MNLIFDIYLDFCNWNDLNNIDLKICFFIVSWNLFLNSSFYNLEWFWEKKRKGGFIFMYDVKNLLIVFDIYFIKVLGSYWFNFIKERYFKVKLFYLILRWLL